MAFPTKNDQHLLGCVFVGGIYHHLRKRPHRITAKNPQGFWLVGENLLRPKAPRRWSVSDGDVFSLNL